MKTHFRNVYFLSFFAAGIFTNTSNAVFAQCSSTTVLTVPSTYLSN